MSKSPFYICGVPIPDEIGIEIPIETRFDVVGEMLYSAAMVMKKKIWLINFSAP